MTDVDGLDGVSRLAAQTEGLSQSLETAQGVTAAFDAELNRMRESMALSGREASTLAANLSRGIGRAFEDVVFEGGKLSDALKSVAITLSDSVYRIAMRPVEQAIGGALTNGLSGLFGNAFPFAQGAAFAQARVMPFARGGVVSQPTGFPMRGGVGVMGEAGPEAIMPLARGADGRLGVQASGGGRGVAVTVNVQTPDVVGFARSQGQIAAQVARAISRADRNI